MPTAKQRIDNFTDAVIIDDFVQAIRPIWGRGIPKVLDDLGKISAHLPPGLNSTDDLKWDLLTEEEQETLENFITDIGPSFNAWQELSASRKAEIWSKVNERLGGAKRQ